jgi:saccharopine dehydrogenase-like NADP-dependent oxidoreductase
MKTVLLLLSTDRFSIPLIRYLIVEGRKHGWKTSLGSLYDQTLFDRIRKEKFSGDLTFTAFNDFRQCDQAIRKADLVIGLMPEAMLLQVADSCILHGKSLITPARLSRKMVSKKLQAEENKTLLLFECGFSPGLDHITAKKAIDNIHTKGGKIFSFKTYSGSLAAEGYAYNPWQFKLTEPLSEIINLGKNSNRHLIHGQLQHIPYHHLFQRSEPVMIKGLEDIISIPEGDSMYYRKLYQLSEASTVVKGKLFRKGFERIWDLIIKLGLTDNVARIDLPEIKSFNHFLSSLLPYAPTDSLELRLSKYIGADAEDIEKLKWLGLFDEEWVEGHKELTSAILLSHLLEKKFTLAPKDKDCIIMQHQLEYMYKNTHHKFTATLITNGDNRQDSAMAKATGLITGAAAKAFLMGNISIKGLHIPTRREIYDPILNELDDQDVAFHIEDKRVYNNEIDEEAEIKAEAQ